MNLAASHLPAGPGRPPSLPLTPGSTLADEAPPWAAMALLAALLFFSEAVFRLRDVAGEATFDGQIALRLGVAALCGLYGLLQLPRTLPLFLRSPGIWALSFGMWALITTFTSIDRKYSAGACIALWCLLLFAPAAVMNIPRTWMLRTCIASMTVFVAASWAVYFLFPELGQTKFTTIDLEEKIRVGGLSDANGLGRIAATLLAMLLLAGVERRMNRTWAAALGLFAIVTILATDSRTALAGAALACGFLLFYMLPRSNLLSLAVFGGLALCLLLLLTANMTGSVNTANLLAGATRSGSLDEIGSLTGRTTLWEWAGDAIRQSPLLGQGYACSRHVMMNHPTFPTGHAHNLLINVTLCTGVVGGAILLGMFAARLRAMFATPDLFPDLITAIVLMGSFTESMLFAPVPESTTMLWLIALNWIPESERSLAPSPSPYSPGAPAAPMSAGPANAPAPPTAFPSTDRAILGLERP